MQNNKEWIVISPKLKMKRKRFAKGSYGNVHLGFFETEDCPQPIQVAVKIGKEQRGIQHLIDKSFENEINSLKQLNHKNVIKLYDYGFHSNKAYLVMEYCENGNLHDLLLKTSNCFLEEKDAKILFRSIMEGLYYIHSQDQCHRDMKPLNILLNKGFGIKLADFGTTGNSESLSETINIGTPYYMSPEMFTCEPYDGKKTDIWSAGIILWKIITGKEFWSSCKNTNQLSMALNNFRGIKSDLSLNKMSPELVDLLQSMIIKNPLQRATSKEILQSKWLNCQQIDLNNTVQSLLGTLFHQINDDTNLILLFIRKQFQSKFDDFLRDNFHGLNHLKKRLEVLRDEDSLLTKQLYFLSLVKILYFLNKILMKVKSKDSKMGVTIECYINQKSFNLKEKFLNKIMKEIQGLLKIVSDSTINIESPNTSLINKLFEYTESLVQDIFINTEKRIFLDKYNVVCDVIQICLLNIESFEFEFNFRFDELKKITSNYNPKLIQNYLENNKFVEKPNVVVTKKHLLKQLIDNSEKIFQVKTEIKRKQNVSQKQMANSLGTIVKSLVSMSEGKLDTKIIQSLIQEIESS